MKTINGLPVYEGTDKCSLDEYSSKMATEIPKIIEEASYDDTETRKDISDIQQEQQTQNANIEKLKQEDIDIKKELERTKKEFNDYAIHGQASGEVIHLTDSAKSSCKIDIKGNVKQETRTGKNLFNIETATIYSGTKELTSDKTGFILRKGTNRINNYALTKALQAGTYTIYFKLKIENSTFNQQNVGFSLKNLSQDNVGGIVTATVNGTYALKVVTNEEVNFLYCFINNGENADCVATITDFMILEGEHTNDESYERYGASPSLNYPSKIKTVGNNVNSLHMQEKSYTQLGVNVTQEESCFKLEGTTNASQNLLSGDYVDIGNFKKGKHIFKVHTSGSYKRYDKDDFAIYIREKNNTSKSYGVITGTNIEKDTNSFIFELTEDTDLVIQIWVNASGIIFSKFEMKLKIEKGEIATSYSPYNLGSVKTIAMNENLYNEDNYTDKLTIDTDEVFKETSSTKIIKIPAKPNSTYTLSRSPIKESSANIIYGITDEEPSTNAKCSYNILHATTTERQIVTTANTKYICIRKYKDNSDNVLFQNIKIEEKEVATSFIEHEENSVIVPIQKEMLEEDYIDKENKKEVHTWNKIVLNGTETIERVDTQASGEYRFAITVNDIQPIAPDTSATVVINNLVSEKLKVGNNNDTYKNRKDSTMHMRISGTKQIVVYIEKCNQMTVDEFKAFLQELYDEGNAIEIYYKTAEPTKLDLTPEQIEASKKLDEMQTYKNITNITTDSIAILDIDYKKDLETLINQVSQAVVEGS